MPDRTDFAARLGLALKALNISRGRLASEARVDKSLVSRWLRGVSVPRGHNLEAVTALMSANVPGFSQLSWEAPIEAFARLFAPTSAGAGGAGAWFTPADLQMTDQKAPAYEGFWRVTHPSLTQPGVLMRQYARIRREADGLLYFSLVSGMMGFSGPIVPGQDLLYAIARDPSDDTFAFFIFHGVIKPKADVLDGLVLVPGKTQQRPLSACAYHMERIGELSGDVAADDVTLETFRTAPREAADVPEDLRRHLMRDMGSPPALEQGVLRLTQDISRSAGRLA